MAIVSTGQITITDVNDYTYQGTTAPKNPIPNVTIWIDTSVTPSVMKRWTGTAWEIVNEVKIGNVNLWRNSKLFTLNPNDTGFGNSVLRTDEADHYYRATPDAGKAVSLYGWYTFLENNTEYIHGLWLRNNGNNSRDS